jgi:hypothetical protein
MRVSWNETVTSGTIDPGSEERLLGRGWLAARVDGVEALRLPLGRCDGAARPVTSLPTLSRVREGLKRQGLRRVVTGRPVTTLAGDAEVRGVVGRAVSSAGSGAHHASWLSRSGSRMGTTTGAELGGSASRLSGCRSSRHPSGAVGTAWRPLLRRDRGPPGTCRSPMTGRASSSDDAARLRCCYFSSLPDLPGRSTPMRLSSAAPGYLNPGTREGPRTNQHPVGPEPVHSEDDASLTGSGADQTPGKRPLYLPIRR